MEIAGAQSMWGVEPRGPASNGAWLVGTIKSEGKIPATYSLEIPVSGTWYLWVRYVAHTTRAKAFTVVIQGTEMIFAEVPYGTTPEEKPETYGDKEIMSPNNPFIWTRRPVELSAGKATLELLSHPTMPGQGPFQGGRIIRHAPVVDVFFLTNDPNFDPGS